MDILTEVTGALQLKATAARREALSAEHAETIEDGAALVALPFGGPCRLESAGLRIDLLPADYVALIGRQRAVFQAAGAASSALLLCRYSLNTALPHPLARQLPAVLTVGSRFLTDPTEVGAAVAMLESELTNTRLGSDFIALRLAEILFVELLRRVQLEDGAQPAFLAALADPALLRSLEVIHTAPDRAWRVDELAERAGLSRAAFAERFHREVGEPPLRYLRSWRLLRARRQMTDDGVRVLDAARAAGYRTANGFSRAFRRFFGHAPNALRVR
jgi:AraC-like DNA-binding protein